MFAKVIAWYVVGIWCCLVVWVIHLLSVVAVVGRRTHLFLIKWKSSGVICTSQCYAYFCDACGWSGLLELWYTQENFLYVSVVRLFNSRTVDDHAFITPFWCPHICRPHVIVEEYFSMYKICQGICDDHIQYARVISLLK